MGGGVASTFLREQRDGRDKMARIRRSPHTHAQLLKGRTLPQSVGSLGSGSWWVRPLTLGTWWTRRSWGSLRLSMVARHLHAVT